MLKWRVQRRSNSSTSSVDQEEVKSCLQMLDNILLEYEEREVDVPTIFKDRINRFSSNFQREDFSLRESQDYPLTHSIKCNDYYHMLSLKCDSLSSCHSLKVYQDCSENEFSAGGSHTITLEESGGKDASEKVSTILCDNVFCDQSTQREEPKTRRRRTGADNFRVILNRDQWKETETCDNFLKVFSHKTVMSKRRHLEVPKVMYDRTKSTGESSEDGTLSDDSSKEDSLQEDISNDSNYQDIRDFTLQRRRFSSDEVTLKNECFNIPETVENKPQGFYEEDKTYRENRFSGDIKETVGELPGKDIKSANNVFNITNVVNETEKHNTENRERSEDVVENRKSSTLQEYFQDYNISHSIDNLNGIASITKYKEGIQCSITNTAKENKTRVVPCFNKGFPENTYETRKYDSCVKINEETAEISESPLWPTDGTTNTDANVSKYLVTVSKLKPTPPPVPKRSPSTKLSSSSSDMSSLMQNLDVNDFSYDKKDIDIIIKLNGHQKPSITPREGENARVVANASSEDSASHGNIQGPSLENCDGEVEEEFSLTKNLLETDQLEGISFDFTSPHEEVQTFTEVGPEVTLKVFKNKDIPSHAEAVDNPNWDVMTTVCDQSQNTSFVKTNNIYIHNYKKTEKYNLALCPTKCQSLEEIYVNVPKNETQSSWFDFEDMKTTGEHKPRRLSTFGKCYSVESHYHPSSDMTQKVPVHKGDDNKSNTLPLQFRRHLFDFSDNTDTNEESEEETLVSMVTEVSRQSKLERSSSAPPEGLKTKWKLKTQKKKESTKSSRSSKKTRKHKCLWKKLWKSKV
ncbi:uncharacterized protein LOC143240305 isoform X1 [Tachypleus tridentatus]|uniref:uncharacterized protein LOC143240305 isoform X1 n=1 Tax=Tachypleus tridentatus TaxID=6853 RepID=UPI003FD55048